MTEYRAAPNPYIGWTDERLDIAARRIGYRRHDMVQTQKHHRRAVEQELVAAHDSLVQAITEAVEACDYALAQIEEARSGTPEAMDEHAETRRAAAALRDSQV